jgi:hypothetical protein
MYPGENILYCVLGLEVYNSPSICWKAHRNKQLSEVLLTKDAISLDTAGNGEFAEVDTIVGGTGLWAGYTGKLTATGTFADGSGEGTYSGLACAL